MTDNTNYTPSPEDNLLGLTSYEEINIAEGTDREIYINAIREADKGNMDQLKELIGRELMPL